jgi:hypothetical protein
MPLSTGRVGTTDPAFIRVLGIARCSTLLSMSQGWLTSFIRLIALQLPNPNAQVLSGTSIGGSFPSVQSTVLFLWCGASGAFWVILIHGTKPLGWEFPFIMIITTHRLLLNL